MSFTCQKTSEHSGRRANPLWSTPSTTHALLCIPCAAAAVREAKRLATIAAASPVAPPQPAATATATSTASPSSSVSQPLDATATASQPAPASASPSSSVSQPLDATATVEQSPATASPSSTASQPAAVYGNQNRGKIQVIPGRGGGNAGRGHGGAKRHRKPLRDNLRGITNPAIRRLARRGGVKRMSEHVYEETRGVLRVFLENVLRDTIVYTSHAKRKTVTALDVVHALKRQGRTLYGFEGTGPDNAKMMSKH